MQIILTQDADGLWGYVVLQDGNVTAVEPPYYDNPQDALTDATHCPTPA